MSHANSGRYSTGEMKYTWPGGEKGNRKEGFVGSEGFCRQRLWSVEERERMLGWKVLLNGGFCPERKELVSEGYGFDPS